MPVLTYLFSPIGQALADLRRHWRAAGLALLMMVFAFLVSWALIMGVSGMLTTHQGGAAWERTISMPISQIFEREMLSRGQALHALGGSEADLATYEAEDRILSVQIKTSTLRDEDALCPLYAVVHWPLCTQTTDAYTYEFKSDETSGRHLTFRYILTKVYGGEMGDEISAYFRENPEDYQLTLNSIINGPKVTYRSGSKLAERRIISRFLVSVNRPYHLSFWAMIAATAWLFFLPVAYLNARMMGSRISLAMLTKRSLWLAPLLGLLHILIVLGELCLSAVYGWANSGGDGVLNALIRSLGLPITTLIAWALCFRVILPFVHLIMVERLNFVQALRMAWKKSQAGNRLLLWVCAWQALILIAVALVTFPLLIWRAESHIKWTFSVDFSRLFTNAGVFEDALTYACLFALATFLIAIQASLLRQAMGRAAVG